MSKRRLISFCATSCGVLLAAGWLVLRTFPLQAAPVPQEAAQSNLLHSVAPVSAGCDAEGRVPDAKVILGPEELRSVALEAVLQWH